MGIKLVKPFTQSFYLKMGKFRHIFVLETVLCSFFLLLFYFILVREKGGTPLPQRYHSGKENNCHFFPSTVILSGILRKHYTGM